MTEQIPSTGPAQPMIPRDFGGGLNASRDQMARAVAAVQKAGMSAERIQQIRAGKPATTPAAKPAVPATPATPVAPSTPAKDQPELIAPTVRGFADTTRMVEALRNAGVSEERIQAALKQDGVKAPVKAIDPRSAEEVALDKAGFGAASDPLQYQVNYREHPPAEMAPELAEAFGLQPFDPTGYQQALDGALREFADVLRLPAPIGGHVIEAAIDAARAYSKMSPAERAVWDREQVMRLHEITGNADGAKEQVHDMLRLWAGKSPKAADALTKAGWFRSADVFAHLFRQSQRREMIANRKSRS